MYKVLIAFCIAGLIFSCAAKDKPTEDDDKPLVKTKHKVVNEEDKKPETGWSDEDKNKLKAEWAKTFTKMKNEVQDEDDFDEADFKNETKKVVSCTLELFQNKFEDYDAYKKASNKDHFTSNPGLLNQLAGCTENLMAKYNRVSQ